MHVITISLSILPAITLFQVIQVLKTLNNSLHHLQFNNHSHSAVDDSAGGRILTADRAAELKESRFKWIPYWESVSKFQILGAIISQGNNGSLLTLKLVGS